MTKKLIFWQNLQNFPFLKSKIIKNKYKNKPLLHLFTEPKGRWKDSQAFTLYLIQTLFYIFWSGIPVASKHDQEGQKESLSISEKHPTNFLSHRTPGFNRDGTSKLPVSIFLPRIPSHPCQKAAADKFHSSWKGAYFSVITITIWSAAREISQAVP